MISRTSKSAVTLTPCTCVALVECHSSSVSTWVFWRRKSVRSAVVVEQEWRGGLHGGLGRFADAVGVVHVGGSVVLVFMTLLFLTFGHPILVVAEIGDKSFWKVS